MIENIGKYYLYRHIRIDSIQPFYIGIGTKSKESFRFKKYTTEYSRAFDKNSRTSRWHSIVNKHGYEVEILLESNKYHFILQKEIELIAIYGRETNKTGILCNVGEGGDINVMLGLKGKDHPNFGNKIHTEEQKKIWSEERKGKFANGDNGSARKVVNVETGEIRGCAKEVSNELGIVHSTFCTMLNFRKYNITNYLYTEDFNKNLKPNELYNKMSYRPIIDEVTRQRFSNAGSASKHSGIERRKLLRCLEGLQYNPTNLVFYEDYLKGVKANKNHTEKKHSREIINIITLKIFKSMTEARMEASIPKTKFESKIKGISYNDTPYMLLEEYNKVQPI